jgi:hypothetical protein
MHEHEQAVTLVAEAATRFRGLRLVAVRAVQQGIKDSTGTSPVVTIELGSLNLPRLQVVPAVNQFRPRLLSSVTVATTVGPKHPRGTVPGRAVRDNDARSQDTEAFEPGVL